MYQNQVIMCISGIPAKQRWQQDNQPIELNTNELMQQKLEYIHHNPVESGLW